MIAGAVIAEYGDDRLPRAELACQPDRTRDIDTGGPAEAQAFLLNQIDQDVQSLLIGDAERFIDL